MSAKRCFVIKVDGTWSEENVTDGNLSEIVGGYLATVHRQDHNNKFMCKNLMIYTDDEGVCKFLPRNDIGERVAIALGFGVNKLFGLCGPLVFIASNRGNTKSLCDHEIASLKGMCTKAFETDFNETDTNMMKRIRSAIIKPAQSSTKKRSAIPPKDGGVEKKPKRSPSTKRSTVARKSDTVEKKSKRSKKN